MKADWWLWLVFVVSGGFWVAMYLSDGCRPDQKGHVHISKPRGDRLEVCDGVKWQPVDSIPLEHSDATGLQQLQPLK